MITTEKNFIQPVKSKVSILVYKVSFLVLNKLSKFFLVLLVLFGSLSIPSHAQSRWVSQTSVDGTWNSVSYGNGVFVAVSDDGKVMTSPDGITWTARIAAANNAWVAVTFGNGIFAAVSRTGTRNRIMTSPDGITWTSRASAADENWRSITYGGGSICGGIYSKF